MRLGLKNIAFLLISFFAFVQSAKAQDDVKGSFEGGIHSGITQFYGDVNSRIFSWKQKGMIYGIHARYNYNSKLSGRFALTVGNVKSDDALSKSVFQRQRNVNFKTTITELGFTGEYNIFGYSSGSKRKYPGLEKIRFSPYVFTGFNFYFFSPKSEVNGKYYNVKNLDTELGKSYKTINLSIPLGLGVKYSPINLWTIGFEVGMRKTFTDFLDGVGGYYADYKTVLNDQGEIAAILSDPSRLLGNTIQKTGPRGNPSSKDWYLFMGFSITKKLYFKNY